MNQVFRLFDKVRVRERLARAYMLPRSGQVGVVVADIHGQLEVDFGGRRWKYLPHELERV